MPFNPLNAVGVIGASLGPQGEHRQDEVENLGSCFAFRQATHFLTAHHCVLDDVKLARIVMPGAPAPIPVESVVYHPAADLALVTIGPGAIDYKPYWEPFWYLVANWSIGEPSTAVSRASRDRASRNESPSHSGDGRSR